MMKRRPFLAAPLVFLAPEASALTLTEPTNLWMVQDMARRRGGSVRIVEPTKTEAGAITWVVRGEGTKVLFAANPERGEAPSIEEAARRLYEMRVFGAGYAGLVAWAQA